MIVKQLLKMISTGMGSFLHYPFNFIVPVYHCVSNDYLPHIIHVINYKGTKAFEKDLDFFTKTFEFSDFDNFLKNYGKPLPKPLLLLTFDDGLSEFKDTVAPILERKGIYAINFVNPQFIGNQDLMFRFKESLLVDAYRTGNNTNRKEVDRVLSHILPHFTDAEKGIKNISYRNSGILKELSKILEIDFETYLSERRPYMSMADLLELQRRGFGIAAHSWDHPLVSELNLDEQLTNIQKSLDFMQLHKFRYDTFAFPFTDHGVRREFFERLYGRNSGLRLSFGTAGIKEDSFCKNIQRIPMENGFSAEAEVSFEKNYFAIKQIFGKNKIHRG